MSLVFVLGARIHSFNICAGSILGASDKAVNKADKSLSYFILNEVKSSSKSPWSREMRNLGFAMFIFERGYSLGVSYLFQVLHTLEYYETCLLVFRLC